MISVVLSAQVRAEARRGRRRLLKFDERGYRIGESNPAAKLTDRDVELMLELRAEIDEKGKPKYSYRWLAEKFECSRETVKSICIFRRRSITASRVAVEVV